MGDESAERRRTRRVRGPAQENQRLRAEAEFTKSSDQVRESRAVNFGTISDWVASGPHEVTFICDQLGVLSTGTPASW